MTRDQLRSFLMVAETASFRRAAQRSGTPQPTLSARIKALEQQIGCELFERGKKGVRLTHEGHRFRHHAEVAVSAMERARASGRLPDGTSRSLSIGVQSYLVHHLGRDLVRQLQPDIAVRIEPDYSDSLIQQVANGLLDFAIVFVPKLVSDLEVENVGNQEILLVATPGYGGEGTSLKDNYIQVQWGDTFFQFQSEALGTSEIPRLYVNSPSLALDLILERGGSAYLDRQTIAPAVSNGQLEILASKPVYRRPVYLIWLPRSRGPDLNDVRKILKTWLDGSH